MAEIEAFLRTGEAPPAAPEPRPAPSRPAVADFPVDDLPPAARSGGGGPAGPAGPPGVVDRVRSLLSRGAARPGSAAGHRRAAPHPARTGRMADPLGAMSAPGGRSPRAGTPGLPPEPPRWTPLRAVIVCAVLLALLVVPMLFSRHSTASPGSTDHASAAPAGPGYAFLRVNRSGTPVRWNPCSPLYYETDLAAAPAYAAADLQTAVTDISRATGILFVNSGVTEAFPTTGPMLTPGGQVGPVVIAWANPSQSAQLGSAVGASGADALARTVPVADVDQTTGHAVYVTGTMLISADAERLPEGFGPGGLGVLFLHQLGHLVGLGNVTDPGQIMNTTVLSSATRSFGPADLTGLKRLGIGSGCLQAPSGGTFQPSL